MRVSSHSTARQQAPANHGRQGFGRAMHLKAPVSIHLPVKIAIVMLAPGLGEMFSMGPAAMALPCRYRSHDPAVILDP